MSKILPKKTKVLVCLSGGVDSSVTAALLVRAGYQVTAAFMINYDNDGDDYDCNDSFFHIFLLMLLIF